MASPPTTPSKNGQKHTPTLINIPPPSSLPETPEPGTPTSTTTSLSALSTVAIQDGHRGHGLQAHCSHGHQSSTSSLDVERADRISRLAGLERVSALRAPALQALHPPNQNQPANNTITPISQASPLTTPTSSGFQPHAQTHLGPPHPTAHIPNVFFDANGQPTIRNKMSTVGTASATSGGTAPNSIAGRTFTTGTSSLGGNDEQPDRDEDILSMDTNIQSLGGGMDDGEDIHSRFEDRMSDDGTASLVGFGEGANSTVSGPIYQRRPMPSAPGGAAVVNNWGGIERTGSGLSDVAVMGAAGSERRNHLQPHGGGGDTPMSLPGNVMREAPRGVFAPVGSTGSVDGGAGGVVHSDPPEYEEGYYETANGESLHGAATRPVPAPPVPPYGGREAAERILRDRLDRGESRGGGIAVAATGVGVASGHFGSTTSSSGPGATGTNGGSAPPGSSAPLPHRLGQFYFEERK